MARRSFARGEPPPPDSWEWVGVAKPPEHKKKNAPAPKAGTPVIVATMHETIMVERKRRPWLWAIFGGALGSLAGFYIGRRT